MPPTEIDSRLCRFQQEINKLIYKRKATSNLTPFQQSILKEVVSNDKIVITNADKGLGTVAISTADYIKYGLKHLMDDTTYKLISEEQAFTDIRSLRDEIYKWTFEHRSALSDDAAKFIRKRLVDTIDDPFGYFYLLIKLHKDPISTRPVCSDVASLPHALGQWVDEQLQPLVKAQRTYFKNSFALKSQLALLQLPPNASVFTYDAVSMYTNIDTDQCISSLKKYLSSRDTQTKFPHYSPSALISAIEIVMRNNRMRFGDIIVLQEKGIAMGMSPAPEIANLFVAIHEEERVLPWLDTPFLRFLKRFIDDGIGIWLHDSDPAVDAANWKSFQEDVCGGGLEWTFSKRSNKESFMDMNIMIVNGKLEFSLFAKPMALHLFIPPNSCHAPGVTSGHVFGQVLRIYQLCSREVDIDRELKLFLNQLLDRGHQLDNLRPLFTKAIENARRYLSQTEEYRLQQRQAKHKADSRRVFFHLPYHPQNPPSRQIQQLWRDIVSEPPGKRPLNQCTNHEGAPIPIDKLVIAYSRAPNLQNLLSCRKIDERSGPKVSSYVNMIRY